MGPDVDKLFLEVEGRPVVAHTWSRFDEAEVIQEIVVVVREEMRGAFEELAATYGFTKPYRIVAGGKERQDSVWNGLEALSVDARMVAIQDGARPCVTSELISGTLAAAEEWGAAVAASAVTDTIKRSIDGEFVGEHLRRECLWSVQTPQTFQVAVIRRALAAVRAAGQIVTDDTAACDWIGQRVKLVESGAPNPKVTVASDLPYVGLILRGNCKR